MMQLSHFFCIFAAKNERRKKEPHPPPPIPEQGSPTRSLSPKGRGREEKRDDRPASQTEL